MKHFVVDTGYLLHLLNVDGRTSPVKHDRVKAMFVAEARQGAIFYVPVPVIFEVCNFISQVGDGASRRRLAGLLKNAVEQSLAISAPWVITPFEGDDSMRDWVDVLNSALTEFELEFSQQEIGLTDIAVVKQARKLASVVASRPSPRPLVHIWTVDHAVKAREPNQEPGAYLGD